MAIFEVHSLYFIVLVIVMFGLRLIIPVANVQVLRLAARRGQGIIGRRDSGEKKSIICIFDLDFDVNLTTHYRNHRLVRAPTAITRSSFAIATE